MEFWISNMGNKLRLPVPPADFQIQTGQNIITVDINDFGEFSLKGDRKLDRITIKSFFPAKYYSFCHYKNFPKPYDCVKKINAWKENSYATRLLITGTGVNKLFYIEDFIYGERAGSRDVEFELSLVEKMTITTTNKATKKKSAKKPTKKRPEATKKKPKTYKVKKGDTLWAIARKYYGDPLKWSSLAKKNGIKDPRKLQIGKVLIL